MLRFRPKQCPGCKRFTSRGYSLPGRFAEYGKVTEYGTGACIRQLKQRYAMANETTVVNKSYTFKGVTDKPCKHFKEND